MLTKAALTSFALEEQIQSRKLALENNEALNKSDLVSNSCAHQINISKNILTQNDAINLTETYDANRFIGGILEPSTSVINENINEINELNKNENKSLKLSKSKRLSLDSKNITNCEKLISSNTSDMSNSLEKLKSTNCEQKKILKLLQELVCFYLLIKLSFFLGINNILS